MESELRTELERLRDALIEAQEQFKGANATVVEPARQRQEAAARRAYQELNTALELAAETEQQLSTEREQFHQRLAKIQSVVAAAPASERQTVIQSAQQESEELDLDEVATRHIIDSQL